MNTRLESRCKSLEPFALGTKAAQVLSICSSQFLQPGADYISPSVAETLKQKEGMSEGSEEGGVEISLCFHICIYTIDGICSLI